MSSGRCHWKKVWAAIVLGSLLAGAAAEDNLDYWLHQAKPATSQPTQKQSASAPAIAAERNLPAGGDALPGAVELSDGEVIAGYITTTRDQPWTVFVENEKRWRLLPPLAVLSITAIVEEESLQPQWRWQAMGSPQRVYTGQQYPFRRMRWKFHLIDGSEVVGTVKGQPFWVTHDGRTTGPLVLHERDKGPLGGRLEDLVYVKRIVISRRAMQQAASTASRPS